MVGCKSSCAASSLCCKVVPGELTVITGAPNSGKSEWIDAVLCNINKTERWPFALSSMENKVQEHARKLLEKHIKKPFLHARYGESVQRMSVEELEGGKKWLNDTFHLIRCDDDCLPSIKWVLELAKAAVLRYGVCGLVIDPYNELDHQRPANQTETEYVSQMLTKIKRFAQHHSCHVWFVAHPKQLQQWGGGPPNLYDISGSAHFINKCDNGIVIHRNRDEKSGPLDFVQVCVRKVRNKVIGNIGDTHLSYNRNFSMIPLGTVLWSLSLIKVEHGVGLNLDNEKPTTCLNTVLQETGSSHQLMKEDVLASFFNKFENMYEIFLNQGFQVLEELYQTTWLHSGQKVVIEEKHEGQSVEKTIVTIQGLTSAGYLLAIGEDNENYELHPDGNSFDFFKGLVRRKLG